MKNKNLFLRTQQQQPLLVICAPSPKQPLSKQSPSTRIIVETLLPNTDAPSLYGAGLFPLSHRVK